MEVIETRIPGVRILIPRKFGDLRGYLAETYSRKVLAAAGCHMVFVQDNDSFSAQKGTVRGLHFQIPPFAQDKLVRVVRGAILDVAVDLRRRSPTFGEHVAVDLSADRCNELLVPAGFAHGFCTLEPETHVVYKVTNDYAPGHERGLLWNDPALGIAWPVSDGQALLSERDRNLPPLAALPAYFE